MRLPFTTSGADAYRYPLNRTDQRTLDPAYRGVIVTWDIDKTYLRTEFDSAIGMLRVPFEFAIDKRAIPGTVPLLKGIRRGPGPRFRHTPLYFVSASPPQLRTVIERKMLLDGVEFDGITFKDWGRILRTGRVAKLKNHIGYKLSGLLLNRRAHPAAARELLFGDDSESDAIIYSTYARILRGVLRQEALVDELMSVGVAPEDAAYVRRLAEDLPASDSVERVFIHLETGRLPETFRELGPLVVPTRNALQSAALLRLAGHVDDDAVVSVGRALLAEREVEPADLAATLTDLRQRALIDEAGLATIRRRLHDHGLLG